MPSDGSSDRDEGATHTMTTRRPRSPREEKNREGEPDAGSLGEELAENRRLLLLPEIAAHYQVLRAQIENTVDVEVVSAVALDAAQAEQLRQALDKRLKRRVRMQNRVDPTLLGGAVIRAGDLVIDGSLKGRLERLATELAR